MENVKIDQCWCVHCGEEVRKYDMITIRKNEVYHNECLPENLRDVEGE